MKAIRHPALVLLLGCALFFAGCMAWRSECAACGAGTHCEESEFMGRTAYQCVRECKSDKQCPGAEKCNCEADACSVHSSKLSLNACSTFLPPQASPENPEYDSHLRPEPGERRFCTTCKPDEVCFDVSTTSTPNFRCAKQCGSDAQCAPPQRCNCPDPKCSVDDGFTEPNVCVVRIPEKAGAPVSPP